MKFSILASLLVAQLARANPAPIQNVVLEERAGPSTNFTPSGGVGVRPTDPPPVYKDYSNFDFQSLNLALNQEYIELDLFHYALAKFSAQEFADAGLNANDMSLIEFMADQEVSHAEMLTNMLGCEYFLVL